MSPRWARPGSQNHNSKLLETQVAQARRITELRRALPTVRAMAQRLGVSHDRLEDAVKGKTWKHVPREEQPAGALLVEAFPELGDLL